MNPTIVLEPVSATIVLEPVSATVGASTWDADGFHGVPATFSRRMRH